MNTQNNTIHNEREVRLSKLNELIANNIVPFKDKFSNRKPIKNVLGLDENCRVRVSGRLISKRIMGKLIFAHISDIDSSLQISISKGDYTEGFDFFKKYLDTGDYIGIEGEIYITKRGEKTVRVSSLEILSKSLRPLPEKFHGLSDTESKYRQRYLDIISNEESRIIFKTRLQTIQIIRTYLIENDFLEVETPILQNVASGASAKPFITHHNSLNTDYHLRIAPELYLKQVVQSGFDRVFEIGKNFRNEGMDSSHLQEFTMLEWYAAYWDYNDNINFLKQLVYKILDQIKGSRIIEYQGIVIDFNEIKKLDYTKEMSNILNIDILGIKSVTELHNLITESNLFSEKDLEGLCSIPSLIDFVFKKKVRPNLIQPTITYNYPSVLVPLARRNDSDENLIDMFQFVVNGWEIVKAYSELVNPIIQKQAFLSQAEDKALGDDEAMEIDESFIRAMEHGMPPMSGLGLGIDRLVSLLTNQATLRDVIFFPMMK